MVKIKENPKLRKRILKYSRRKILKILGPAAIFAGFSTAHAQSKSALPVDALKENANESDIPKNSTNTWKAIKNVFGKKDGFKYVGKCKSIAELRDVAPEFHGQSVMVTGYYAWQDFKQTLIYDWDAESEETDDGGLVISSSSSKKGRFKLRADRLGGVYDCAIWGMLPSTIYSEEQMDINPMLEKAITAIGKNGVLHFSLPAGWDSAHYLNNKIGQDFSGVWLSADEGVIIHSPFTSDNESQKPRLKSKVTFSESAPLTDFDYATSRERNDYSSLDGASSAFAASISRISDKIFPLPLAEGSRAITFSLDQFHVATENSGMVIENTSAKWVNPGQPGINNYSGLEFASADGTEISINVQNLTQTDGKLLIGARVGTSLNKPEDYVFFRISVNSPKIEVLQSGSVIRNYHVTHPTDIVSPNVGVINIGVRVSEQSRTIHLILNGKPFPPVRILNPVKSLLVGANESARQSVELRFAHLRLRESLSFSKPLSIAILGDSISRGARTSNEWPQLLSHFAEHMPGLGRMTVKNHSVSGIRLHVVAGMIDRYDFKECDFVLVMLGTNDCQMKGADWVTYYAKDMLKVIDKIVNDGATPVIGVFPRYADKSITGNGIATSNASDISIYQHYIREICVNKNIMIADVDECFGDNYGSSHSYESKNNNVSSSWSSDNLHPNSRGQLAIASAFAAAMSKATTYPSHPSLAQLLVLNKGFELIENPSEGLFRVSKSDNTVSVSGRVRHGQANSILASLPAWARPSCTLRYTAVSSSPKGESFCSIEVRPSGEIVTGPGYTGEPTYICFSYNM